jgi:iron-sulfur cluster repair protein YtfE (RIC family)
MSELTELGQVLHEEHFRIVMFLSGLQNRVSARAAERPLDPRNAEERAELEQLIACLDEIVEHNAFEEAVFYPLIWESGEGELATLLTEEHATIGPLTRHLRNDAAELLRYGIATGRWPAFCRVANKFVTKMMLHLEREELTFVQRLAFFVDPDLDHRLAVEHAADRLQHTYSATFSDAAY